MNLDFMPAPPQDYEWRVTWRDDEFGHATICLSLMTEPRPVPQTRWEVWRKKPVQYARWSAGYAEDRIVLTNADLESTLKKLAKKIFNTIEQEQKRIRQRAALREKFGPPLENYFEPAEEWR